MADSISSAMNPANASVSVEQPEQVQDVKSFVGLWHERIDNAGDALKQWADSSGAKRFIQEYRGDFGIVFHTRNKKVPVPPVNEVFAYVQADIATTYNRDPYIAVNPKAGTVRGAAFWEVILNYYWRHLRTKEEIEYEIIDKDLVGFGWHKVGYDASRDTIYSNFVEWKDILFNIGSRRPPEDCQWMAQRIVKPLWLVKKLYPNAKALQGQKSPEIDEDRYKRLTYKDDIKVAVLYEVWDLQTKTFFLLADGMEDDFLEAPKPWPEYLNAFPFLMYWDFAVPGGERPMSAIAPWEAQILEEMILMASATNHAKRWNRQLFIKGGSVDEQALDKFERGDDGAIITVNANMDDSSFKFADFGQLPTDFYLLMDRLQAIKRNINGQPEFLRGGVTKTGTRTVGELELLSKGAGGRQDRKIDRLETHMENIARHMMAHLKANFDFENAVHISGETPKEVIEALGVNFDPVTKRVIFTPEDIQGEYDVEIKAGSTLPLDKQTRLQMLEIVLNTIAAAVREAPMSPFLYTLIQEILRDYDIKGLREAFDAEMQQAMQAQMQQAGQQSIQDQKTQAEAQKREAQAQQIQAESAITEQDAALGPIGRAQVEALKKPQLQVAHP